MLIRTFVLVFFAFAIFIFGGCVKNNDEFILTQFESKIDIKAKNTEYKGTVFFDGDDTVSFIFSKPETLSGIKITSDSDGAKYAVGDMMYDIAEKNNAIYVLGSLLSEMKNDTVYKNTVNKLNSGDNAYEVSVDENGTDVRMICDEYEYYFSVG